MVDALAGVLSSQRAAGGSFLDIGAGLGYFSLAAAARGHSVHAFELGPENLELLRHGVKVNGFQNLVDVHEAALGGPEEEKICISRTGASEALQANLISGGYASTATHAVEDGLGEAGDCTATAMRRPLGPLLSTEQNVSIGVVRIGANGWEG